MKSLALVMLLVACNPVTLSPDTVIDEYEALSDDLSPEDALCETFYNNRILNSDSRTTFTEEHIEALERCSNEIIYLGDYVEYGFYDRVIVLDIVSNEEVVYVTKESIDEAEEGIDAGSSGSYGDGYGEPTKGVGKDKEKLRGKSSKRIKKSDI